MLVWQAVRDAYRQLMSSILTAIVLETAVVQRAVTRDYRGGVLCEQRVDASSRSDATYDVPSFSG